MTSSLNKKVIIVGASSGIGKELAILYARAGCRLGITGRRAALLDEIKSNFPAQVETAVFDVMGQENILQLEKLIQQLGGLDLFIYNAGYGDISKSLDWKIDKQTVLTNVNGFTEMACYAWHYFAKQGHGQIAATSSIAAITGNHFAPAYSASKAFMSNYMEGLYIKARKNKLPITVTDIQPGFVKTPLAKGPGRFWEATAGKAALQMMQAIEAKKFRVYITKRWWLIAQLLKILPGWLFRRI
ncbi:MAG: SDR family NAD(P)-dependent oxidoreductase [Chitinophagaceae bacterium]